MIKKKDISELEDKIEACIMERGFKLEDWFKQKGYEIEKDPNLLEKARLYYKGTQTNLFKSPTSEELGLRINALKNSYELVVSAMKNCSNCVEGGCNMLKETCKNCGPGYNNWDLRREK
jgi:hypothetical protein